MHVPIRLGPVALLLTVITICLTTLSILTWSTAGADLRLAERYAETAKIRYELELQGQQYLRDAGEMMETGDPLTLMDGVTEADGVFVREFHQDGYTLTVGIRQSENEEPEVASWKLTRDWEQDQTIHGLWDGQ
ncbi:MAG: hypothetical protein IJH75_01080 [Mogibacterium sp.]|nr:hypothetical protein [Mogibacterium sp.]